MTTISSPDRVVYPETGTTKATVAVPIAWSDLDVTLPTAFELGTLPAADPLEEAAAAPAELGPALAGWRNLAAELGVKLEPFDRFRS